MEGTSLATRSYVRQLHTKRAASIADSSPRPHGPEGDDLSHPIVPVFLEGVADQKIALVIPGNPDRYRASRYAMD